MPDLPTQLLTPMFMQVGELTKMRRGYHRLAEAGSYHDSCTLYFQTHNKQCQTEGFLTSVISLACDFKVGEGFAGLPDNVRIAVDVEHWFFPHIEPFHWTLACRTPADPSA